jgi:hypothetical protein
MIGCEVLFQYYGNNLKNGVLLTVRHIITRGGSNSSILDIIFISQPNLSRAGASLYVKTIKMAVEIVDVL